MKAISEMRSELIEKADNDSEFRARLLTDPKSTVADEFGLNLPDSFKVHVVEDDAENAYFVLPPSSKLTSEQMASVSGGGWPHNRGYYK